MKQARGKQAAPPEQDTQRNLDKLSRAELDALLGKRFGTELRGKGGFIGPKPEEASGA